MRSLDRAVAVALTLLATACQAPTPPFESCFDPDAPLPQPQPAAPTYFADIKPLVDARCTRCHEPGGIGPFPLTTYDEVAGVADLMHLAVVVERSMPPFQAVACCNEYRDNDSLTDTEIALVDAWVKAGAPAGAAADEGPPMARVGGLSRVDLELTMPEPYVVNPEEGRTDDFRCFILDWPITDRDVFVTGLNPSPSNRAVMHHLIAFVVEGQELDEALELEALDDEPGFACEGGPGSVRTTGQLGGSLLGTDFPEGFGHPMPAGAHVLLSVHYSLAHSTSGNLADQTTLQVKIDDDATPLRSMAIAQPAWLLGDAFRIEAGDADAAYRVALEPTLYTRGRTVRILGVTPHMHAYGSSIGVDILRQGNAADSDCLLDIPRWIFGWEQPYWLAQPVVLEKGDEVRIECHFNNADQNPELPRDIAWGEGDQDMCAAFLAYAFVDEDSE